MTEVQSDTEADSQKVEPSVRVVQTENDNGQNVLEVQALSAGYSAALAVENISFTLKRGECVALVGPNGAGKSTLLKTVIRLLKPRQGEIAIHGDRASDAVRHIAYVPQFGEVDWNFPATVWDVVMMGRARHIGWFRLPMPGSIHHEMVKRSIERVGLAGYAKRQIGQLSGGEQRRVFIARALAQEADILLLDEPFAGVDVRAQDALFEVLDGLRTEGVTVLLSTHDLSLASTRFDRIILLDKELVAFGKAADVFTPDLLTKAYGGQLAIWRQGSEVFIVADQHR